MASKSSAKPNGAAKSSPAAAVQPPSSSGVWLSPMTVAALVVLLAVVIQVVTVPSVTGPPSSRKPYASFQQFYPFYASEHSDTSQSHADPCPGASPAALPLRHVSQRS